MHRWLTLLAAASLAPMAGAQAPAAPVGHYHFATVSLEGDPFEGDIFLTTLPGGRVWGRVFTTIQAPIEILEARELPDGLEVLADLRGQPLRFRLRPEGDAFVGAYQAAGQTIPVRAWKRQESAALRPVPCRAPNLGALVQCAVYLVPENRALSGGPTIPLNIVILPATGSSAGALFHFAGGPGQAATEQAAGNAQRFAAIRPHRDIVMIDQRGTGGSNGLTCEFPSAAARAVLLLGGRFPPDDIRRCRDSLVTRADLRFYHTSVAADDVAEVAAWLGHDEIDLYGGSYGTRAALAVMRQHPRLVRTATLRAVEAPEGSLAADNPASAQASLELVFAECRAQPSCHGAFPDLNRDFRTLMERLRDAPPSFAVRDPATGNSVSITVDRGVVAGAMRRMLMDAALIPQIPLTVHEAALGDLEYFRTGIERTIGVAGSLFWGMGLSVVCAEDPAVIRARGLPDPEDSFLGDWQARSLMEICEWWPSGTPVANYSEPVRVDTPTLLLSGKYDPATPPAWGAAVARHLPNGIHLIMDGVSHAPFPECAVGIMTALIESGSSAGLDTSCIATLRLEPFVTGR